MYESADQVERVGAISVVLEVADVAVPVAVVGVKAAPGWGGVFVGVAQMPFADQVGLVAEGLQSFWHGWHVFGETTILAGYYRYTLHS